MRYDDKIQRAKITFLEDEVASREIGAELPPARRFLSSLGVSIPTLSGIYHELKHRGVLAEAPVRGTMIADNKGEAYKTALSEAKQHVADIEEQRERVKSARWNMYILEKYVARTQEMASVLGVTAKQLEKLFVKERQK